MSQAQVLVVGGGIAGITAAWELQRQGIPVKLIESTPHLGGRMHSVDAHGGRVETGMQFYYSGYRHTKRLLKQLNLHQDLVPIHIRGTLCWDGKLASFDKNMPWLGLLSAFENLQLQASVAQQLIPFLRADRFGYGASEPLGDTDTADYFGGRVSEAVFELAIRPLVNSYAFCEPEGHSFAMLLKILKLAATGRTFGLRQGNDALPQAMAKSLEVIHARARRIIVEDGCVVGVEVEREGKVEALSASTVVCATRGLQAAELLADVPETADALNQLSYSSVLLANLSLGRAIEGRDWTYVMSRKEGHQSAFAVDLMRRSPTMFPDGKSVVQVNFASPVSDAMLGLTDDEIVRVAIRDMETFVPGIGALVEGSSVVRRPQVLPNFAVGMFDQVLGIQRQVKELRGLHLAGDYLRAPLCEGAVRSAFDAVDSVIGDRGVLQTRAA